MSTSVKCWGQGRLKLLSLITLPLLLLLVLWLQQLLLLLLLSRMMADRPPFQLKGIILVYNLFQTIFSAWGFLQGWRFFVTGDYRFVLIVSSWLSIKQLDLRTDRLLWKCRSTASPGHGLVLLHLKVHWPCRLNLLCAEEEVHPSFLPSCLSSRHHALWVMVGRQVQPDHASLWWKPISDLSVVAMVALQPSSTLECTPSCIFTTSCLLLDLACSLFCGGRSKCVLLPAPPPSPPAPRYLTRLQMIQFVCVFFHALLPLVFDCGYPKIVPLVCFTFIYFLRNISLWS